MNTHWMNGLGVKTRFLMKNGEGREGGKEQPGFDSQKAHVTGPPLSSCEYGCAGTHLSLGDINYFLSICVSATGL